MKKKITSVLLCVLFLSVSSAAAEAAWSFIDVKPGYWAYDAISKLGENGFINGYKDGTFRPDGNITKAQFMTILSKVLEGRPRNTFPLTEKTKTFSDVPASYWAYKSINNVLSYMWNPDAIWGAHFEPEKPITREEVAAIIAEVSNPDGDSSSEAYVTFRDIKDSPFKIAIMKCAMRKLVNGYPDNSFKPGNSLTRAEAAVVLTKLYGMSANP